MENIKMLRELQFGTDSYHLLINDERTKNCARIEVCRIPGLLRLMVAKLIEHDHKVYLRLVLHDDHLIQFLGRRVNVKITAEQVKDPVYLEPGVAVTVVEKNGKKLLQLSSVPDSAKKFELNFTFEETDDLMYDILKAATDFYQMGGYFNNIKQDSIIKYTMAIVDSFIRFEKKHGEAMTLGRTQTRADFAKEYQAAIREAGLEAVYDL